VYRVIDGAAPAAPAPAVEQAPAADEGTAAEQAPAPVEQAPADEQPAPAAPAAVLAPAAWMPAALAQLVAGAAEGADDLIEGDDLDDLAA
jgi:hypothetical protein